jgi:hypothetical protein
MIMGARIKLIGNGTFRILRDIVKDMENDTITDKKIGSYTIHIRKHANDIYSGRIDDWAYALGKKRKQITDLSLVNALEDILNEKIIKNPKTIAIGCYIE